MASLLMGGWVLGELKAVLKASAFYCQHSCSPGQLTICRNIVSPAHGLDTQSFRQAVSLAETNVHPSLGLVWFHPCFACQGTRLRKHVSLQRNIPRHHTVIAIPASKQANKRKSWPRANQQLLQVAIILRADRTKIAFSLVIASMFRAPFHPATGFARLLRLVGSALRHGACGC